MEVNEEATNSLRKCESPPLIRKKKLKLLPALLWFGLAYAVFQDTSSHVGKSVTATEILDDAADGTGENGFVTLDDTDTEEAYDLHEPAHRSLGNDADVDADVDVGVDVGVDVDVGIGIGIDIDVDENDYDENINYDNIESGSDPIPPNIIIVAAVDGTLAGISKESGRILWKQSEDMASTPFSSSLMRPPNENHFGDTSHILKPLVSTTTTTKSASDASYKAVPSVDGTIYTTTNDMTITTSVRDLVAKSPFLDHRGRFHVGSRYASTAALDGETGEVLRVVSSTGNNAHDEDEDDSSLPTLDDRNVIWIGRVDYEISVQDAKTGMIDAQYSVSQIMSVADMNGMMGKDAWKPDQTIRPSDQSSMSKAMETTLNEVIELPSALVATPNGNVALWNYDDEKFAWVADESFDSPIAYAMDAATGLTMGVDIIPDVPDPSADIHDLTREMERQSEMASVTNTPVVGAMSNGQLYALPLRRKRNFNQATSSATIVASTSSVAAAALSGNSVTHSVSHLPGRSNVNLHHNDHNNNQHQLQQQPNPDHGTVGKNGALVAKKACVSTSPTFPSCLIESHNDQRKSPHAAVPIGDGKMQLSNAGLVATGNRFQMEDGGFMHPKYGYVSPQDLGGFYHPEFGYVSPRDLYGTQKRSSKKSYQKLFRVLGSWLPPTIALLFVVSFELGRRKRLKDEKKGEHNPFLAVEQKGEINGVVSFNDKFDGEQRASDKLHHQEVISVSEDVLGYGGHGTVVYKGVLDGRDVAVKRMLKAYHASADREISLLIESDGDPNVVRYFLKEVRGDFVYLALELCDLSLHELIGVLRENQQEKNSSMLSNANDVPSVLLSDSMDATTRILLQIASGVKHLHSLRIVHRDLKPANILLAISKQGKKKVKDEDPIFATFLHNYYDAKISDMGLGKQLIGQSSIGASFIGESSFRGSKSGANSIGVGPGTVGWQAPEVMAMRLTSDTSARSMDSVSNTGESKEFQANDIQASIRTSRSIDIFSLGCIFYSLLIPGLHPFGEWFEREANIMHNRPNLQLLRKISSEAYHLIRSMLDRNPRLRPTATEVCEHPFFWTHQKKMTFLCDFSDRLETDTITPASSNVFSSLAIERGAVDVVGTSWEEKLDSALVDNVQKFRTYDYSCVRDLLRLIRNKHHHFEELPDSFRLSKIPNQNALCDYFTTKFPVLVMHCYTFCSQNLTDDDPLVSKFIIPPAKFEARDLSTAPKSVTVKRKKKTPEEGIIMTNQTETGISYDESKSDSVDNQGIETVEVVTDDSNNEVDEGIIVWEGSIAARTFNCRGWSRSQDEWSRHIEPFYKKRDPASKRCMEDPKFRTRLCNHWDMSLGTFCPMKKKNKCVFAHGPPELRVKEGKKNRWGKLVDKNGNNSNPWHSGGEDTYGAANSIEQVRKEEGKWNASKDKKKNQGSTPRRKKCGTNNQGKQKSTPKAQG